MQRIESLQSMLQNIAEAAASYRAGQAVIKQADRALWAVEKTARWAVPPALDQDEEKVNSPELIRPLPWLFFLWLLIVLRVFRESLSLANLVLGKPPVRAADIVTYIQSRRRYLRALKYQGNRNMRARINNGSRINDVLSKMQSIIGTAFCFRNAAYLAANHAEDDAQVVIRVKKTRSVMEKESGYASPAQDENTMEKLIEKMVDMNYDSSDDSEYTLTNAASIKSDSSVTSGEESRLDTTMTRPDTEPISSTPKKSYSSPASPECSNIHEYSLLDSPEDMPIVKCPKNASVNIIEAERQTASAPIKKMANGQATRASTNAKRDVFNRRDSDVPVVKITPAEESNTNGSTEGLYYRPNKSNPEVRAPRPPQTQSSSNTGRNTRNKTKESKIRYPSSKKSKK